MRPYRFRLGRSDILAIDNTRMLHARSAFHGTASRHLRRYWVGARPSTRGEIARKGENEHRCPRKDRECGPNRSALR